MCIPWTTQLLLLIHPIILRLNASNPETPEKERKI